MNSGLFTMTMEDFKRGLMIGIFTGVLAMLGYITHVGSIFGLDLKNMVDVGVLAAIPAVMTWIGALLTTAQGNFAGAVKVQ